MFDILLIVVTIIAAVLIIRRIPDVNIFSAVSLICDILFLAAIAGVIWWMWAGMPSLQWLENWTNSYPTLSILIIVLLVPIPFLCMLIFSIIGAIQSKKSTNDKSLPLVIILPAIIIAINIALFFVELYLYGS
jgi:hypothetical protein